MRLDCPTCQRSYDIESTAIGSAGRSVICSHCAAQWFVRAPAVGWQGHDLPAMAVSGRVGSPARAALALPIFPPIPRRALAVAALACLAAVALVHGRDTVVRTFPRAAALYALAGKPVNLRGLDFANVRSAGAIGQDTTVSGSIRNVTVRRVKVPNLRFEARDGSGGTLVSWRERAAVHTLSPGRGFAFSSMPHRLPETTRSVLVEFEDGDDHLAVLKR